MERFMVASIAEKRFDKGSWSIMTYTGYSASHLVLVRMSTGQVYHANGKLVCTDCKIQELLVDHAIIDSIEFSVACTSDEFEAWWKPLDGLPYSDWQFGGVIFSWTKRIKNLFKNGRRGAICTEFVCWFMYDMMGREEFKDLEFGQPWAVFNMVKKAVS